MSDKERKQELKMEYLRGVNETEQVHRECNSKFLDLVKDKLTDVIDDSDTLEEAQDEVEKVIQMIDEYCEENVPVDELIKRKDRLDTIEDTLEEIDNDDIISLTEFVREDF